MQFVHAGSGIEYGSVEGRMKHQTALRWVAKCCPSLPHSLINKLFRQRQVRLFSLNLRSFRYAISRSMFQYCELLSIQDPVFAQIGSHPY